MSLALGAILPAAVGALGSVVGGFIGSSGTKKAADNSLQATRETNASNERLAQEQRDFEYRMMQEQNAYNSLSAQRQRAEEAGFSPYILGGQNSFMQSQLPQYQRAEMQVPSYDLQAQAAQQLAQIPTNMVASALSGIQMSKAYSESEKVGSEKQAIDIENSYRTARIVAELSKMQEETRNTRAKATIEELNSQILGAGKKALMQRASLENELIAQQVTKQFAEEMYARSMTSINAKQIKWLDAQARQGLAQSAAQTALLCAQRGLSLAETKRAIANTVLADVQARGVKIDNDTRAVANTYANAVNLETVRQMQKQTEMLTKEIGYKDYNEFLQGIRSIPIIGTYNLTPTAAPAMRKIGFR